MHVQIFTVCTELMLSVHRADCEQATQPDSIVGGYDFSRLKTSRVLPHTSVLVIECFLTRSMLFLKCIYTHYIQSFFTCTISETICKLITHCFCCLLRCVVFSRSLTMSMHNVARLSVLHYATVAHAVNTPGKSVSTG